MERLEIRFKGPFRASLLPSLVSSLEIESFDRAYFSSSEGVFPRVTTILPTIVSLASLEDLLSLEEVVIYSLIPSPSKMLIARERSVEMVGLFSLGFMVAFPLPAKFYWVL